MTPFLYAVADLLVSIAKLPLPVRGIINTLVQQIAFEQSDVACPGGERQLVFGRAQLSESRCQHTLCFVDFCTRLVQQALQTAFSRVHPALASEHDESEQPEQDSVDKKYARCEIFVERSGGRDQCEQQQAWK